MRKRIVKPKNWGTVKKPTGGSLSWIEGGVDKQLRLGTFIRDHLISVGGDHIQSTWGAYKRAVKGRGKKYNPGSYSNVKYYFYMLKKLGLIKEAPIKRKANLRMGQRVIADPIVYRVINSSSDAWNRPRVYYDRMRK